MQGRRTLAASATAGDVRCEMCNGPQENKPDYKLALELARYELDCRRKKQWDIFSWSVTILVSVIGGMIVLTAKEKLSPNLASSGAMASALLCLVVYAAFWIWENIKAEEHADTQIKDILKINSLPENLLKKSTAFALGYVPIVLAMGVAAIAAVLLVNMFPFWFAIVKAG